MQLNVLLQGQSNITLTGEYGAVAIQAEVERLLGFDGTIDKVNILFVPGVTAVPGSAFLPTSIPAALAWTLPGNIEGSLETAKLNYLRSLPADMRAAPTAVLWMHSEYDSLNASITSAVWEEAIRFDAVRVREALGQGSASTPYLFVDVLPFPGAVPVTVQAMKSAFEHLANTPSFNAAIAARTGDLDMDSDPLAGVHHYGGAHMGSQDIRLMVERISLSTAQRFASYARSGSPVALAGGNLDAVGPTVSSVTSVQGQPGHLMVSVSMSGDARNLAVLNAQAASGIGWSLRDKSGNAVQATSSSALDNTHLLVVFPSIPVGWQLYYGYGVGRLAMPDAAGMGNAIYDNKGQPLSMTADGMSVTQSYLTVDVGRTVSGWGGSGSDGIVSTSGGVDTVSGGDLNFIVYGGMHGLRFLGGMGTNQVSGGAGAVLTASSGAGTLVALGRGPSTTLFGGAAGHNVLMSEGGDATMVGGGDGDSFSIRGSGQHNVWSRADGSIDGSASMGIDMFSGAHAVRTGMGVSHVQAGPSGAMVTTGSGRTEFTGGGGNDTVASHGVDDLIRGGSGHLTAIGGEGHMTVVAGSRDTLVVGSAALGASETWDGAGGITISAGAGRDVLHAGTGGNSVFAGKGIMEILDMSGAANMLVDVNGWGGGLIVAMGFRQGVDRIHMEGFAPGAAQTVLSTQGQAFGGSMLRMGDGTTMFLGGVSQVLAGDFA